MVLSFLLNFKCTQCHLDAARPVGVHAAVLVVEALQLELKVRPEHQGLVHLDRRVGEAPWNSEEVGTYGMRYC